MSVRHMSHQDAFIPGETCTFKGKITQCILGAAVGLQQMQVLQRCSNLNANLSIDVGICGQMNPTHEDLQVWQCGCKSTWAKPETPDPRLHI